jgi:threonine synthase
MRKKTLRCLKCNTTYPLRNYQKCQCGGILTALYDYKKISYNYKPSSVWDYFDLLPVENDKNIVTLYEGMTPLIHAHCFKDLWGLSQVFLKDETRNPTGSFKDRPSSVAISKAKELGVERAVVASSGNAAASAAAYAARAAIPCTVHIQKDACAAKLVQAQVHGADIVRIEGDYSASYAAAYQLANDNNWCNITSTYINPYTFEGDKIIAYELFNEMGVPDIILVPIGAGALLYGIWKGFYELTIMGISDKMPKMIGVQPNGCSPIVDAFLHKQDFVKAWNKKITTKAHGISDALTGYAEDGTQTLNTIYISNGAGVKVSDGNIHDAQKYLARQEGIFAEPAGAAGVAAVISMMKDERIKKNERVVVIITGHGLKKCS